MQGLSLVAASGGHSSSRCAGLSLSRPLLLQSTGSRRACSAVVAHRPSCSAACGILPDQGSNPCPLHWQSDSQPLRHQGSPRTFVSFVFFFYLLIKSRIKDSSALKCLMIWSFSNWREIEKVTGLVSFYYTCQEKISSQYKGFLLLLRPGPWGLEKMAIIITLYFSQGCVGLVAGRGMTSYKQNVSI